MEQQCVDMSQPMLTIPNDPTTAGVPNPHQGVSKKAARSKKMAKHAESSVPIEEALKTELTTNNMKTPISVLQELLSRRGITPQYDLIQVEGAVHEPTFRYRVSYKDKDAMGTGKSKKEAKHAAAKALIEKLTGSTFNDYPGAYIADEKPDNMKTPISVLQELLSRRGITPQYDLIQVEGTVHEPAFRYRVSYQDKDAMGTGKSKKEAKQAAARALIEKLMGSVYYDQHDRTILNGLKHDAANVQSIGNSRVTTNEEESTGNPIGWLQEMCMARRWPPPTYETETEKGLPHERQFTIACVVLKFREVGEGKSKKVAKRQAAQKMWQRLQDQPWEPSQLDEDGNEEIHRYQGVKDGCTPTLTTSQSQKVSQFHKALKSRTGENLQQLQSLNMHDREQHFVDILDEIAKEQRFEVTYVDIDEKSFNGKYQCLVQLSTMPVAVCYGSGITVPEAHARAAQHSLEYLRIMTKC
ncbi:RISC-loading complex subunit tarbp2 [Anopheles moucheti]|uniref:RISC-loading complex subunit tarbp2 n=1 Tax=Anopheles moucheti TaxID=186751 RepID=UPI0022F06CDF|nr:RISC-loading complex subunit tarbp2 [Anopheles moucheti]